MGKKKSVALIVIMVIVLAGLAFLSVASFPLPSPNHFTPLLGHIRLSTDLGGGYYTVYYPEGVISQEEYDLLVNSETGQRRCRNVHEAQRRLLFGRDRGG